MERNNESRNRYNNDRGARNSDYNNNWNQSSDFQENRNRDSDRFDNQWDSNSLNQDRERRNYGQHADRNTGQENRSDSNRYGRGRNGRRLDSMGSIGNDTDRFDEGDYNRGSYGQSRYAGGDRNSWDSSYNNRNNESRNWWDKTKDEVSGWFGDENAQQRRNMDQQGEHRGKGPKGYVRTDERIKEDVHERLTDDATVDASEIEVDVKNGEVFLKGTVKNRQEKRRAEDIIENISGVKNVENRIKVQSDNQTGNSGQGSGQYGERKFGTTSGSGINVGTEFNTHN
jgi:osmotically-inducible protein OsmY